MKFLFVGSNWVGLIRLPGKMTVACTLQKCSKNPAKSNIIEKESVLALDLGVFYCFLNFFFLCVCVLDIP